jgi:DNA-binding response OmpR family regulator
VIGKTKAYMNSVILIDDDRTNSQLIAMVLEMDGFVVTSVPNIERAQLAMRAGADALIIDCNLSGGENGIDLLRLIRAGKTALAPDTPVIVTSGDDRRRYEAVQAGADSFFLKPYPPSTLSAGLTLLLAGDTSHG